MAASFPSASDLTTFLQSVGVLSDPVPSPNPVFNAAILITDAIRKWEDDTGCDPFAATTQTRYFDPPGKPIDRITGWMGGGRVLDLGTGIISISSLYTGLDENHANGVLRTENLDFVLYPREADKKPHPFTYIEFKSVQYGFRGSIGITGSFGYSTTLYDSAYQAVMLRAAIAALPQLGAKRTGGAVKIKLENDSFDFTGGAFSTLKAQWQEQYREYVEDFAL